jgi:hypothetical protein
MGLFGPLGSAIYGGLLHGVSGDVYGFQPDTRISTMQFGVPRPLPLAARYLLPSDQGAADVNSAGAAPPVANPMALPRLVTPLRPMDTLGTFTTRRTQLFGPLSGFSI